MAERARADAARSEQAGHQRDADRVVGAGLALQERAAAPRDLALTEHREDHRRIGRGDRGRDEQRREPCQAEREVDECSDGARGEEGAQHADDGDGGGGGPELPPPHVEAAVEQDAGQRDAHQPLDGELRRRVEGRHQLHRRGGGHQDQQGSRDLDALGQPVGQQSKQPGRAHEQQFSGKDVRIGHSDSGRRHDKFGLADQASRRSAGQPSGPSTGRPEALRYVGCRPALTRRTVGVHERGGGP